MPSVDLDPSLMRLFGRLNQAIQFVWPVISSGIGKTSRMEFDHRGLKQSRGFDLFRIRINKKAGENSGVAELLQDWAKGLSLAMGIESTLRGDLGSVFRD